MSFCFLLLQIANVAIARRGNPSTAVAACFASPLFNVLIGMGGSLLLHIGKDGPIHKEHLSAGVISLIVALLSTLLLSLVLVSLFTKFVIKKWHSITLLVSYSAFTVYYCLLTAHVVNV